MFIFILSMMMVIFFKVSGILVGFCLTRWLPWIVIWVEVEESSKVGSPGMWPLEVIARGRG